MLACADGEKLHAATSSVCSSLLLCAPSLHLLLGWVVFFLPPLLDAACVLLTVAIHFQTHSVKERLKCFDLIQESPKIEVVHHLPCQCGMSLT